MQITNYNTVVIVEVQIRISGHTGIPGGKSEESGI